MAEIKPLIVFKYISKVGFLANRHTRVSAKVENLKIFVENRFCDIKCPSKVDG